MRKRGENMKKTCMVTGHRKVEADKIQQIKQELQHEIEIAIQQGYTHFISGFASGVDLYFAAIVAELKEDYKLFLEAAIPYRNRINSKDTEFKRLLSKCSAVGIHSEKYSPSCYIVRNRFMVQSSDLVIAVYDGRETGGTDFTIRYARIMEKEIKIISI